MTHARDAAFSYQCHACSRCCHRKRIQVNPYELVRLARNLGTTTTDVIARFTVDEGTVLATRANGACVFLGPAGCTVHADRPLVCRLYPLGRIVRADGSEVFVENEPHPQTEGEYGENGTVRAFIDSQGVAPYIAAADRYFAVLARLTGVDDPPVAGSAEADVVATNTIAGAHRPSAIDARWFIDADMAFEVDRASGGPSAPAGVEAAMERHLALILKWASALVQRDGAPGARDLSG